MSHVADSPKPQDLRRARDLFRQLLHDRAREPEWQAFFAQHPFVFSRSLPLRLSPREIIPLGRPGKTEPDFIFYQRTHSALTAYGVIELKRPDSKILTFPRHDLVVLTRDADTAVKQAQRYSASLHRPDTVLIVGAPLYLFVVMGLTEELVKAVSHADQVRDLVPPGCQILPYDGLLRRFEATLPERIVVLAPCNPSIEEILRDPGAGHDSRTRAYEELLRQRGGWWHGNATLLEYATNLARDMTDAYSPDWDTSVDAVDAEGIAHEALLQYFQHAPAVGDPKGWLADTIQKLATGALRGARHIAVGDMEKVDKMLGEAGIVSEGFQDWWVGRERLLAAVAGLPISLRTVVELELQGHTVAEIASTIGISTTTARRRIVMARHCLSTLVTPTIMG